MIVTNTRPTRIHIAGQSLDPYKASNPIEVREKDGSLNVERTAKLVAGVKASPVFKAGFLVEGVVAPPPPVANSRPDSLDSLDDIKALAYIKIEDDHTTLVKWADGVKDRKNLIEAIAARVVSLRAK